MSWSFRTADPGAVVTVAFVGVAYAAGLRRWGRTAGRRVVRPASVAAFALGLAVAAVALASPLDTMEARSLTAHMVQHVLLLSVAGPLLAVGAPLPTLLWALPASYRQRAVACTRRLTRAHDRRFPMWVTATLVVEATVMWAWHVPATYQAAVRNAALHGTEHALFVASSTALWWSIVNGRRSRRGAAALAALVSSLPGMALGAAMVLAPRPWYGLYIHGSVAAALRDQEVAGVVMWAFGGMACVIAGTALFASWLASADDRSPPNRQLVVPPLPAAAGGRR